MKFRSYKGAERPDNPYDKMNVYLPKFTVEMLKEKSDEIKIPVGRLIAYAIDTEMERDKPFDYDVELPRNTYVPNAYAEEAGRIKKLIAKFPRGIGLDALCIFRHGIGIPNKLDFLLGFRELQLTHEVTFKALKRSPPSFQFTEGYEFIFLTEEPKRMPKRASRAIDDLTDENRILKAKLAKAGIK